MEKDRVERYAQSLERTIQNNYRYLKEAINDFQEMCRMVTPERNVPREIIVDIREMYKEIRNRLTEIKAIEQLLHGKYRQYYRRDSLRDKEIMEFGFISKNCYSKFEYTLLQIEAMRRLKEGSHSVGHPTETLSWFQSKENQIALIKNLRTLMELDYEPAPEKVGRERRDMSGNRALTLFLFFGDFLSMDRLQSLLRLREHDILERYSPEEVRGVLTHLREMDPLDLKRKFQVFMENNGLKQLKCLLLTIRSPKDLEKDLSPLVHATLREMSSGELRIISI